MIESEKVVMQRALDSLIESARLLGAMQEKKSSGIYTKTDSMFEGDFYEIIDVKKQIILEAIAQPAESPEPDLKWCGSYGEGYAGFCRAKSPQERCPMTQISNQHALLCAEAYQVVGSLLSDLRQFDTGKGRKVLDNLSQGCVVHEDVLPWPSFVKVVDEFSIADLALEYFGEYSEKHYDFAVSLLDLDNVEIRGIK